MAEYWLTNDTPEETPELGSYSFGTIDKFNPAPEGAEIFPNKAQLDKAVKALDKAIVSAIENQVKELEKDKSNNGRGNGASK